MKEAGFEKIWALLGEYFPNAQQFRSEKSKLAWWYGLRDFDYDDVNDSAPDWYACDTAEKLECVELIDERHMKSVNADGEW